ncbi:PAS domain-containing sensor histidine kinase [Halarcobacter sp.]|uniref:PAS domain-containing sensor histidine kinase n=1 Tax=Halarcobacter sp. TaxID=2321133 RepID=UPI003A9277D6
MNDFVNNNLNSILEASFSLSNQAIYLLNQEGEVLFANNNALETLGYTKEEITKLHVWDIDANVNTEEKYLDAVKMFHEKGPDGQANTLETYHRRKDGRVFPVEVVSKFTKIDGKEYLFSYARDITSRVRRTEEINLYFDLINSSKDMIFVVDHESELVEFANETACDQLGYTLAELKKTKISNIRKPMESADNIAIPEVLKKIKEENSLTTFGVYTTKDGVNIPVETSLHLKEYQGKFFVTAISRDISERLEIDGKREELNLKLKNYNKTLEKEISKVKKDLLDYESIMKRQSKMAAMGEMLENIAHQWRQPLSAVSVLSTGMILQNEQDLLNKDLLDAGLNDINEQVQYLSKTIDDFRNFFKPNKQKNRFNLKSVIKTSIKLSKARYTKKHIEFITSIEDMELFTYENELLQVLLNIITNAKDELIKKEGKKFIIIDTCSDEDYLYIKIKDNAGGIDKFILDRIFEPYFTTKHNSQGTGIGLYMSKNIVKHMNGKISVKNENIEYNSSVYLGACFEIKLPFVQNR